MTKPILGCLVSTAAAVLLSAPRTAAQHRVETQTDWSRGIRSAAAGPSWGDVFDGATDVSWRSIPGQLALSSTPVSAPPRTVIAGNAEHPSGIALGDLDSDGLDDLVVSDPVYDPFAKKGAIDWWRNTPTGSWERRRLDDFYGARYVDTVDLDGDGDTDVIAAAYFGLVTPPPPPPEQRNGRYAWFENVRGDGSTWVQHSVGELYNGARFVDAADIDGDGDLDLVGASELTSGIYSQAGDIVWFENRDGAGTDWTGHDLATRIGSAFEAHAGDVDGDGDMDVVGTQYDEFDWWENVAGDGSEWRLHRFPSVFRGAGHLDLGDFDEDGDLDAVGTGYNSGSMFFWENTAGTGRSWAVRSISNAAPQVYEVRAEDFDGDGDLDIAYGHRTGILWGGVAWLENRNQGAGWALHYLKNDLGTEPFLATGDADGDGKPDLAVALTDAFDNNTEQLHWWNLTSFVEQGELVGPILDGGASPDWDAFSWNAEVPPGTTLRVDVRAARDIGALGSWSEVPVSGDDLEMLVDPHARFLQYRLRFSSGEPARSPIVRSIDVAGAGTPALVADRGSVAASRGGTTSFGLDAGDGRAQRTYVMLASLSGTFPGTALPGGALLPLEVDAFTLAVAGMTGSPPFTSFAGALDAAGRATARLDLPPLPPAAAGLTIGFAYALLAPVDFASNAVELRVAR